MKNLFYVFFEKTNLFLVWLIWYIITFSIGFLMFLWVYPHNQDYNFIYIMSAFFATFGTLVIYLTRLSDKAWDKLRDCERRIKNTEDLDYLNKLLIELGELKKNSITSEYSYEVNSLKEIINIKMKYITISNDIERMHKSEKNYE